MPVIKLSKVTIPPPRPKGTPVSEPLPGAPFPPPPFDGVPIDPSLPDAGGPVASAPPVDPPVDAPVDGQAGEPVGTFAAAARVAAPEQDATASIPTELIERLWRAVEIVPGLTLDTALTLALQQFLASIPDDYEREDG